MIKILALSWRDIRFPNMGGAEIYTHEVLKRAAKAGFKITHFAPASEGLPAEEIIDGVRYLRKGSLIGSIFEARKYYRKNKADIDFVIDQCNTFRFFTKFWIPSKKRIFLIFQLTREIWFIQSKGLLARLGYFLETPMLKLNKNDYTITESESTKNDLVDVGFLPNKIKVIPVGIKDEIRGITLPEENEKEKAFIYVGRYAKYKGIDATVEAFCRLKEFHPEMKLWLVGKENTDYIENVLKPICAKYAIDFNSEIKVFGFVSEEKKFELMRKSLALVFPSNREGWGMTISEAGALGTPSVTYDVPGTRDAVDYGNAGYLCRENTVDEILNCMQQIIDDKEEYAKKQRLAYDFAQKLNFDTTGELFIKTITEWSENV